MSDRKAFARRWLNPGILGIIAHRRLLGSGDLAHVLIWRYRLFNENVNNSVNNEFRRIGPSADVEKFAETPKARP